ncbi:MAG: hypothetical protein R6X13_06810 [bacterium]
MTTKTIAKRMSAIEKELRQLELRLKRRAARGKKPPLTELRGLWKSCGDIGEDEIRRVEVRLAADD